jgi:hypothetical protein
VKRNTAIAVESPRFLGAEGGDLCPYSNSSSLLGWKGHDLSTPDSAESYPTSHSAFCSSWVFLFCFVFLHT